MPNDDISPKSPLAEPWDLAAGLGLMTRIPVTVDQARASERGARAAWSWPVAGAIVGLGAATVGGLAMALGLPATVAAGLAIAGQVIVTGAMHEDGLADSADGLWGGWDRDRRLEIMKDSRIGAYGVLALVLSLLLRWASLSALFSAGALWAPLIVAGAVSRAVLPAMMGWMPAARSGGLSRSVGRPPEATLRLSLGIGAAVAVVFAGFSGLSVIIAAALVAGTCAAIARAKIGGQTGDILGATQQMVEIAVLGALLAAV